jgi:hypothetical protein
LRIFDEAKKQKDKYHWKGTYLCNSADLTGELLEAVIATFRNKVDEEINGEAAGKLVETHIALL